VASACAWSVALVGLEGRIVEVEADIGAGLPRTVLVGLPDSALYQARDRCKAAVSNSGQEWPISLLTINLSPATLPKAGSHYDLAIVAAILAAQGTFSADELRRTVLLGELGLDQTALQRPTPFGLGCQHRRWRPARGQARCHFLRS
jgi:magnesium chelatase family protein